MITMNKIKDKVIFLLFLNIIFFSSSFPGTNAYILNEINIEEYQWVVKPDSSSEFAVTIESNSTINTTVDDIIQEYNLLNLTQNLRGNKAFEIIASNITYKYDLMEIAQDILNFTGPIIVERLIENISVPIQRYTLPFFIPIDHWNDLEDIFFELLPNATLIDHQYFTFLDEHKYSINWYDDDTGFTNEYWLQWRGYDGVLSGFGISSSTGSDADLEKDSILLEISSSYIPTDDPEGDFSSLIMTIVVVIICLAAGTIITYIKGDRSGTLYKIKKKDIKKDDDDNVVNPENP